MKKSIKIVIKINDTYYTIPIQTDSILTAIGLINDMYVDNIIKIEVVEND